MAKTAKGFAEGDRVRVVTRSVTADDRKANRYYTHMAGLVGKVENAYEGEARDESGRPADEEKTGKVDDAVTVASSKKKVPEPEERWLHPVKDLSWFNVKKLSNWTKYLLLQGVARDVVSHDAPVALGHGA